MMPPSMPPFALRPCACALCVRSYACALCVRSYACALCVRSYACALCVRTVRAHCSLRAVACALWVANGSSLCAGQALDVPKGAADHHSILIVDNCNLSVAQLMPWATAAQAASTGVFVAQLKADPAKCAARNIHGWKEGEVVEMAGQFEETPPHLPLLDYKSLGPAGAVPCRTLGGWF